MCSLYVLFQCVHRQLSQNIPQAPGSPVDLLCTADDATLNLPNIKMTFIYSNTRTGRAALLRKFRTEPYGINGWRWETNCPTDFVIKSLETTIDIALKQIIDDVLPFCLLITNY
jgi:hypothetical protein